MITKVCSKCKIEKDIILFPKRKESKDGHRGVCKECDKKHKTLYLMNYNILNKEKIRLRQQQWVKNNPDKIKKKRKKYRDNNIEKEKLRDKNYYLNNTEKRKNNNKNWYLKNRESVLEKKRIYQEKNKDKIKQQRNITHNKKYTNDILYKLKINVRNRLKLFLKSKNFNKTTNKTYNLVGCTPQELKQHIEKQFKEGMSWDNHQLHGWHIDHIIPLSLAKNEDDIYKLCHYTNLQPIWCDENYSKGTKINII